MAEIFPTPQEYLTASRPVDPQLDMRRLLTALAGAVSTPQTSYAGLSAEQVSNSASNTRAHLENQLAALQNAQQAGVQQERASFQDAQTAHQTMLADKQMQIALAQLQLQKAAAGRAAANEAMARQLHQAQLSKNAMELELLGQKLKFASEHPEQVFGKTPARPTQFEQKQNQLEQEASRFSPRVGAAVKMSGGVPKLREGETKARNDFFKNELNFGKEFDRLGNYYTPVWGFTADDLANYDNNFYIPQSTGNGPLAPSSTDATQERLGIAADALIKAMREKANAQNKK